MEVTMRRMRGGVCGSFTEAEIAYFRKVYAEGLKLDAIADDLKTHTKTLWHLRKRLGLPERHKSRSTVADWQIKMLRQMWADGHKWEDIRVKCGLSRHWLAKIRKQLRLGPQPRPNAWSEADKEYLIENWGEFEAREIARHLGRTIGACQCKAAEWGLTAEQYRWPTHLEDALIRLRKQGFSFGQIAKRFGRSKGAIIGKADRMGLLISRAANAQS